MRREGLLAKNCSHQIRRASIYFYIYSLYLVILFNGKTLKKIENDKEDVETHSIEQMEEELPLLQLEYDSEDEVQIMEIAEQPVGDTENLISFCLETFP